MQTAEARVTPDMLDAIQVARGPVPLAEFRLRNDCAMCLFLADLPATDDVNQAIRLHALDEHPEAVLAD